ncbi:GspE/PulE family protein [Peptoniphilus sp. oral taxon 386]|uniref:GspE/PulE family protein n=1 Tax=Peptoniphilus sp. oral taxon 386 TaxID=652713 RepID=UPI000312EF40|nr:GspE/PulE family protein [Peptoniphilus sp. oral taxon 386]
MNFISDNVIGIVNKDISMKYNVVPKLENNSNIVFWSTEIDQNTQLYLEILLNKTITFEICSDEELINHRKSVYSVSDMSILKSSLEDFESRVEIESGELELGEKSKVSEFLNNIIFYAIENKCSDIHIDGLINSSLIRVRIDGILMDLFEIKKSVIKFIINRIKVLSNLDYTVKNIPQDGRFSFNYLGKNIDIRVAITPTIYSEKVVLRILDRENVLFTKKGIGLHGDKLKAVETLIKQPNGLILVCGPTGSGKTSTLYTLLKSIQSEDINILTIEDPVEYKIEGINQLEINEKVGFDFNSGLKTILRLDPDKIMVGEIRDKETASTSLRASITGHLVLSTLHTNDSPSAIYRLKDMGIESYLISAGIIGIISQRLVRKLCDCKIKEKKYIDIFDEEMEIYKKCGCPKCANSGYAGRKAVFEILILDDELKEALNSSISLTEFRKLCKKHNMISLKESMKELLLEGITSLDEVYKNIITIGDL